MRYKGGLPERAGPWIEEPVKYLLIGYLFGIPSEPQIEWRIHTPVRRSGRGL